MIKQISGFPPPRSVPRTPRPKLVKASEEVSRPLFPTSRFRPSVIRQHIMTIVRWKEETGLGNGEEMAEEGEEQLEKILPPTRDALLELVSDVLHNLFGRDTRISYQLHGDNTRLNRLQMVAEQTKQLIYVPTNRAEVILASPPFPPGNSSGEVWEIDAKRHNLITNLPRTVGCMVVVPIVSDVLDTVVHGVMTVTNAIPKQFGPHDLPPFVAVAEEMGLTLTDMENLLKSPTP